MHRPRDASRVEVFEASRPRLLGLAYRMLGLRADAEDVVQDVWLRWQATDVAAVERPEAWLTTTTTRLAIDRLRVVQRRRELHLGAWLPEPLLTEPGPDAAVDMAESLTLGFLTVLDRLQPVERAVFLLADVFGAGYREIAESVGRSEGACRQIASRARRRVRRPEHRAIGEDERRAVGELLAAISAGDVEAVLQRLAPDVVCVSDLGRRRGGRQPVTGADRVARFLVHLAQRFAGRTTVEPTVVNGDLGVIVSLDGAVDNVAAFEVAGQVVTRIWIVRDPDKLDRLHASTTVA